MDSPSASTTAAAANSASSEMTVMPREMTASAKVAEDDGSLSVALALAKEAALLFQSGKYADCLRVLNELSQKKPDDLKVLHNISITESFQDGCSDPRKLLDALNNIKKRIEELAYATGGSAEADRNVESKTVIGSKGSIKAGHQFSSSNSSLVYTDEYDNSVTLFNMAVIWFHLHEHAKSFSILDLLFQNIEPIDEGIALHICLLLLDVALASQHASRCLDVINYMERVFSVNSSANQVDNGNATQQQPSTMAKAALLPSNSMVPDALNSDPASSLGGSLSRTLSDETLEDESIQLLSSLDITGQKLPKSSGLQASNDLPKSDEFISVADLRLRWHLYKVHLLLLTRNLKAAKREVKMAMNMVRGNENCYPMALYLKSQLEYARGNHRKAIKLLMASSYRTEMGISSIYYNNLGCIYFRLGKYHTSNIFFSKALSNSSSLRKEKPLKLSTFSQDKSLLIVYNCGVQYMACGKPLLAARCFHKASQIFCNRPLLWLRIAECCLMASEKGLVSSSSSGLSDRSDVKVHIIGKGKWRQLVMEDEISQDEHLHYVGKQDLFLGDGRQPCLSLPLARRCLFNALHLLDLSDSRYSKSGLPSNTAPEETESRETISSKTASNKSGSGVDTKSSNINVASIQVNSNGEVKEQKSGNSQNAYLLNSVSDYEDICRKENQTIRQALLADLAYVELELGNPLRALSMARSLLKLPECSKIYVFLGNIYAAEALCLLSRPKEAAEHLFTYVSGGMSIEMPYSQEDCEKWRAEKMDDCEESNGALAANKSLPDESQAFLFLKPEDARGTLYANLAAMSAMQGDFEQALEFVTQALSVTPNSPEAILTAVYVDLMRGKEHEALAKLRQRNRIRFLPSSLRLNGS